MKKLSLALAVIMMLIIAIPAMAGSKVDGNQVTFTHTAPDASMVYLSGTFNGWSPTGEKMTKGADGVWSVTIKLKPATYQYKFVVDGVWTPDKEAATLVDDGFSGKNAILIVKAAGAAAGGDNARFDALEAKIAALEQEQGGFSFHGSVRAGILMQDNQQDVNGFWPSGAWAKYRLGNEADTFAETGLDKRWKMDDGSYALVHALYCHQSFSTGDGWAPPYNDAGHDGDSTQNTEFFMRELYAELGNLPEMGNLTYWAGQRYYRRDDIHILDYFWRDLSGVGAGVQGIKLGDIRLDLAYMAHSGYKVNSYYYDAVKGKYTSGSHNLLEDSLVASLIGIKAGPGSLDFDLVLSSEKRNLKENAKADDGTGYALFAKYTMGNFFGLTDGSSFVGLAYTKDLNAYGFSAVVDNPDNNDGTEVIKLLSSGVIQINDNFEIQPVLIYLNQKNDNWNMDTTWTSIGARPVYHFNKNFALQFEVGFDNVDEKSKDSVSTSKYTLAPTITLDKGFYTRPQLRVFVTQCEPDNDDSFTLYGVQMEAWW